MFTCMYSDVKFFSVVAGLARGVCRIESCEFEETLVLSEIRPFFISSSDLLQRGLRFLLLREVILNFT